mmetsp:Transcript_32642/g.70687  ORF Transcript_32642/g.70687 Transcript_32642/m.70687 type:complete len:291 (+) Transcript_32642:110-982(+)
MLASRSLNSALCTPPRPSASASSSAAAAAGSTAAAAAAADADADAGADGVASHHPPAPRRSSAASTTTASSSSRSGEVEAIRVAVRLKPLSANNNNTGDDDDDDDEIDPQVQRRAWRVLSDSSTIVQECPIELPAAGRSLFGGTTPSKLKLFGTPSKATAAGINTSTGTGTGSSQSTFTFDHVYGENSTTSQIYGGMVRDIVDSVTLRGINGTVFAYGQTSSGKTFTMQGNHVPVAKIKTISAKLQQRQQRQLEEQEAAAASVAAYAASSPTSSCCRWGRRWSSGYFLRR